MEVIVEWIKGHISSAWIKCIKFSLGKYGFIDIFSHINDDLLYTKIKFSKKIWHEFGAEHIIF